MIKLSQTLQVILLGAATTVALAYPTIYPTGTTIYDPVEAYSSYVLVSDHSAVGNHPSARVRAESRGSPSDVTFFVNDFHGLALSGM